MVRTGCLLMGMNSLPMKEKNLPVGINSLLKEKKHPWVEEKNPLERMNSLPVEMNG